MPTLFPLPVLQIPHYPVTYVLRLFKDKIPTTPSVTSQIENEPPLFDGFGIQALGNT